MPRKRRLKRVKKVTEDPEEDTSDRDVDTEKLVANTKDIHCDKDNGKQLDNEDSATEQAHVQHPSNDVDNRMDCKEDHNINIDGDDHHGNDNSEHQGIDRDMVHEGKPNSELVANTEDCDKDDLEQLENETSGSKEAHIQYPSYHIHNRMDCKEDHNINIDGEDHHGNDNSDNSEHQGIDRDMVHEGKPNSEFLANTEDCDKDDLEQLENETSGSKEAHIQYPSYHIHNRMDCKEDHNINIDGEDHHGNDNSDNSEHQGIDRDMVEYCSSENPKTQDIDSDGMDSECEIDDDERDHDYLPEKNEDRTDDESAMEDEGDLDSPHEENKHEATKDKKSTHSKSSRVNSTVVKHSKYSRVYSTVVKSKQHFKRTVTRTQVSKNPRKRKICDTCGISVVDMARHQRYAHDKATQFQVLRATAKNREQTSTSGARYRDCPMGGCPGRLVRLDKHLINVHRLSRSAAKELMKETRSLPRKQPSETQIRSLLQKYKEFLLSAERLKNEETASQNVAQIQFIAQCVDADTVEEMLDSDSLLHTWLEPFRKQKQPGTVKSYLGAFKQFLTFLETKGVCAEKAYQIKLSVDRWSASMSKLCKTRAVERQVEDFEDALTVEDFEKFNKSEIVATTKEIFQELEQDLHEYVMEKKVYNVLRNFLILEILLNNAQRSGAICGITIKSVRKAQKCDEGYIINIPHHKTGNRTVAVLFLPNELYEFLQTFVKVRVLIPQITLEQMADDAEVFLCWPVKDDEPPTALSSKRVSRCINQLWNHALGEDSSITPTQIRKLAVTEVRDKHPDAADALASHMTHRKTTADINYLLHDRQKEAATVSSMISKSLGLAKKTDDDNHRQEETPNPNPSPNEQESQEEADEEVRMGARRSFSKTDSHLLITLCKDLIRSDGSITAKNVLERVSDTHLVNIYNKKQLSDRVRTARRGFLKGKISV